MKIKNKTEFNNEKLEKNTKNNEYSKKQNTL